jgi:hypothetical protein
MPDIQSMVIDDEMAKALSVAIVRLCFRDTCLENYHSGEPNWADLIEDPKAAVIHSGGATPLDQVRRFTRAESHAFRHEATDALYTVLLNLRDPEYLSAIGSYGRQGLRKWDSPSPDPDLQVIPSRHEEQVPKILLGDFMSAKLAFGIVKVALDCEEMSALEAGVDPLSQTGDQSDIRIIYKGQEVPWTEVGRVSNDEMRILIKRWIDRVYTVLKQLHDTKFLVTALRLGAEVEAHEETPTIIPYLANARILTHPF